MNAIGFDGSEVSVKQAADCFFLLNGSLRAVGRAGDCFIAFPGSSLVAALAESVSNRQSARPERTSASRLLILRLGH